MSDLRQTNEYINYLRNIGWTIEKKNGVFYFIKKFPIFGSIIKIQRPKELNFKIIESLRNKYRAFQITIEPDLKTIIRPTNHSRNKSDKLTTSQGTVPFFPSSNSAFAVTTTINHNELYTLEFKLCNSPFLPTKTIQMDLTKSEENILKEIHQKTRYNIKIATKNQITINPSDDIETFIRFWHKCHRKRMLFLSLGNEIREIYKAFKKHSDLLFAIKNKKLIAALLLLYSDDTAYYMYAAANGKGKKLYAPTQLTWEGIKLAKKKRYKVFDFEGIYDERFPIKSWLGFTKFKKGFRGEEILYPGCYYRYYLCPHYNFKKRTNPQ